MNDIEPGSVAQWMQVAAIIGFLAMYYFKGPKEYSQDQQKQQDAMSTRVTALEGAHQGLALRFENSHARHDESLDNLTEAIKALSVKLERIETLVISGQRRARSS